MDSKGGDISDSAWLWGLPGKIFYARVWIKPTTSLMHEAGELAIFILAFRKAHIKSVTLH